METFHSAKGWRQLRTGEVPREGDIRPAGYGCFELIPQRVVGRTIIAGDVVFRARTRASPGRSTTENPSQHPST